MKPWIGKNYYNKGGIFGKRIMLVVGWLQVEGDLLDASDEDLTTNIINDYLYYLKDDSKSIGLNFFMKIELSLNSLINKKLNTLERIAVWDSIAFYSYCQKPIISCERPTEVELISAVENFFQTLKELRPEGIIALGYHAYSLLPDTNYTEDFVAKTKSYAINIGHYNIEGNLSIPLLFIPHPGSISYSINQVSTILSFYINGVVKYDYEKEIKYNTPSPHDFIIRHINENSRITNKEIAIEKFEKIFNWLKNGCCPDIFSFNEQTGKFTVQALRPVAGYVIKAIKLNYKGTQKSLDVLFLNSSGKKAEVKTFTYQAKQYQAKQYEDATELAKETEKINKQLESLGLKHP